MKTPCCIIKDVLPLYAEGMTSEETAAIVSEHLGECAECSAELESLSRKETAAVEAAADDASGAKFIKNVKKKIGIRTVLYIAAAAIATALLGCLGFFLSASRPVEVRLEQGVSAMYTSEEINKAYDAVIKDFENLKGCRLYALSYAGDERSRQEAEYRHREYAGEPYADYIDIDSEFRSPLFGTSAWNNNTIYTWHWILGREEDGDWVVLDKGYC